VGVSAFRAPCPVAQRRTGLDRAKLVGRSGPARNTSARGRSPRGSHPSRGGAGGADPLRPRLAGEGGRAVPDRRHRGPAGRRPQRPTPATRSTSRRLPPARSRGLPAAYGAAGGWRRPRARLTAACTASTAAVRSLSMPGRAVVRASALQDTWGRLSRPWWNSGGPPGLIKRRSGSLSLPAFRACERAGPGRPR
jgi:hypothetical protein